MLHWLKKLFGSRPDPLSRSNLVGMYLTQTNGKDAKKPSVMGVRERREGRFSQKRGRR